MSLVDIAKRYKMEDVFTEDEMAMLWMALNMFNVGSKEEHPRLYKRLEEMRKNLLRFFE